MLLHLYALRLPSVSTPLLWWSLGTRLPGQTMSGRCLLSREGSLHWWGEMPTGCGYFTAAHTFWLAIQRCALHEPGLTASVGSHGSILLVRNDDYVGTNIVHVYTSSKATTLCVLLVSSPACTWEKKYVWTTVHYCWSDLGWPIKSLLCLDRSQTSCVSEGEHDYCTVLARVTFSLKYSW